MRTRTFLHWSLCASALAACSQLAPTDPSESTGTAASAVYLGDVVDPTGAGIAEVRISFSLGKGGVCSGTLITNEWLLTAQHCTVGTDGVSALSPSALTIFPHGKSAPSTATSAIVRHPTADAALLHLASPATVNGLTYGFARPLYNQLTANLKGSVLKCYGYGQHDAFPTVDDLLREVDMTVDSTSDAAVLLKSTSKKFTAHGDSGGPCFLPATDGYDLLASIDSGGPDPTDGGAVTSPETEVSVSAIANWIADNAFDAPLFAAAQDGPGNAIALAGDAPTGWDPAATTADLNGDGCSDWIYPSTTALNWKTSRCDGTFDSKNNIPLDGTGWLASRTRFADVDHKGGSDWIYVSDTGVTVRFGQVDGARNLTGLDKGIFTSFASTNGTLAAIGDVDGDGNVDVVVPRDDGLDTLIGLGDGHFRAPVPTSFGSSGWLGGTAFASVHDAKGFDWIYVNDPFATFKGTTVRASLSALAFPAQRGQFSSPGYADEVHHSAKGTYLLADVTGDGRADFIAIEPTDLYVFAGLATPVPGTSSYFATVPRRTHFEFSSGWAFEPEKLSAADVNGDGCADIVDRDVSRIWVKPANCVAGKGDGSFGALVSDELEPLSGEATGPGWVRTRMAPIDADGRADLVNLGSGRVNAKLSIMASPPLVAAPIVPPPLPPLMGSPVTPGSVNSLSLADSDGNGQSDRLFSTTRGTEAITDTGATTFLDGWCNDSAAKILVGDFDGDHHPDLLCRHGDGTNSVARGDGSSFGPTGARFTFCDPSSQLFAGAFFTTSAAGLLCHDPATGANTLEQPDPSRLFDAPTASARPAFCGSKPGACVKESNKELCWDGVDNNCNGQIDEGCPARVTIGAGQLVMGDFDADGHPDFACHESAGNAVFLSPWSKGYFSGTFTALPISGSFCDAATDVLYAANVDGAGGDDLLCRSAAGGLLASLSGATPFTTVNFNNPTLGFCTAVGGQVQFGNFDGTSKAGMACVLPGIGLDFPAVLNDLLSHTPPPAITCPPGSTSCG